MSSGTNKWILTFSVLIAGIVSMSSQANANWTLNLGYQNPVVSTWGLNLLYIGSQWGFEVGVGWVDAEANVDEAENNNNNQDRDKNKASIEIAGDVDLKYFFTSGTARPFLQGGFGVGLGAKAGEGAGAGTGGGFVGLGILLGSPSVYGYGSFNINGSDHSFLQAGLGVDI